MTFPLSPTNLGLLNVNIKVLRKMKSISKMLNTGRVRGLLNSIYKSVIQFCFSTTTTQR